MAWFWQELTWRIVAAAIWLYAHIDFPTLAWCVAETQEVKETVMRWQRDRENMNSLLFLLKHSESYNVRTSTLPNRCELDPCIDRTYMWHWLPTWEFGGRVMLTSIKVTKAHECENHECYNNKGTRFKAECLYSPKWGGLKKPVLSGFSRIILREALPDRQNFRTSK